jgi:cytochrome c5
MRFFILLALIFGAVRADEIDDAKKRWAESPHGPMLERILPPTFDARQLPEPQSEGAQLTLRYCVQCHNLPNPAMHDAARWPGVVKRMVVRMEGRGNMGKLMSEMMAGVKAPGAEETRTVTDYLVRQGQEPIDASRYPVYRPEGEAFRMACNQCHVLPDPRRHNPAEWRAVVSRMQENMEWMNRVVGSKPLPGEPQLRIDGILAFLERYARR